MRTKIAWSRESMMKSSALSGSLVASSRIWALMPMPWVIVQVYIFLPREPAIARSASSTRFSSQEMM